MAKKTDQKTLDLINDVKQRKLEISKLEKPNWKTNCSFTYIEGKMNDAINLHTVSKVQTLVEFAGYLLQKQEAYQKAANLLAVDAPEFQWSGFAVNDWLEDFKTKINIIQLASKKKKLEELETRLNLIISPELKAQMELDAIAAELS